MPLPSVKAASQSARFALAQLAGRVRCSVGLEQAGALPLRGLSEDVVPFGERPAKLAAPGPEFAQAGFEVRKFACGERADAMARRAAAVTFTENGSQFLNGETDGERSLYQTYPPQSMRGKQPVP